MKHFFFSTKTYLVFSTILIALFVLPNTGLANESIAQKCNYQPQPGVNPPYETINCLLTESALHYNVPPEIIKGIAEVESGNWRQFNQDGTPIISNDGGIGIMQITSYQNYVLEDLKNDIAYNIKAGVETLDSMFTNRNDLPKINDHKRDVIEQWYFAVMAYNGIKPKNSPIEQLTGKRNTAAYQEKLWSAVKSKSLLQLVDLPFSSSDFHYDRESTNNIQFLTKHFTFDTPLTTSKYYFKEHDIVKVNSDNVRLREQPDTQSPSIAQLEKGRKVKIIGSFEYDTRNHFVFYPVQLDTGTKGYVASSYLGYADPFKKERDETTIVLEINNHTAKVDGNPITLDAPPYVSNGRTMVPLRFINESFGANVHWDGATRTITITKNGTTLTLRDKSKTVTIIKDGSKTIETTDVSPVIRKGVTFVPTRFVSEQVGAKVTWDSSTRKVTIKQ